MKVVTALLLVLCMCINVYADQFSSSARRATLKISDCLVAQRKPDGKAWVNYTLYTE